jgi:putative flippase GtrA
VSTTDPVRPRRRHELLDTSRLLRYGVAGGLSMFTHVGTLTLLVEAVGMRPVWASSIGFALSVLVSYSLQKWWVFASGSRHRSAIPKFLVATCVALLLNAAVIAIGTDVLHVHYVAVQVVALVLIPVSNYLINSLWTFR